MRGYTSVASKWKTPACNCGPAFSGRKKDKRPNRAPALSSIHQLVFAAAQGLHGLQGFFAEHGLQAPQAFFAAQGLQAPQAFFAAHGLHAPQAFFAAHGLHAAAAGFASMVVTAVNAGTARAKPNNTGIEAVDESSCFVVLRIISLSSPLGEQGIGQLRHEMKLVIQSGKIPSHLVTRNNNSVYAEAPKGRNPRPFAGNAPCRQPRHSPDKQQTSVSILMGQNI